MLEGVLNFDEERQRLQREIDKVVKDIDFVAKKLNNQKFISRAPEEIVKKEKDKEKMLKQKEAKLRENIARMNRLCA